MLGDMAVNMTIDLNDATFADLVALVDAARVAGVDPATRLATFCSSMTFQLMKDSMSG